MMSTLLRGYRLVLFVPCLALSCQFLNNDSGNDYEAPAASKCRIGRVGLRAGDPFSWDGAHNPACTVDADGAAQMVFTAEPGCGIANPWRSCVIAKHHDFVEFADRRSVYEADVCVEGPLPGALILKIEYAPDANGAAQKQLTLRTIQEWETLSSGCLRATFRADDLSLPEHCSRRSAEDLECLAETEPSRSVDAIDLSEPTLKDVQVLLTLEGCNDGKAPRSTSDVMVSLRGLSIYPSTCFCQTSDDCAANHYCDADGWLDGSCCRCASDCPKICRPLDSTL